MAFLHLYSLLAGLLACIWFLFLLVGCWMLIESLFRFVARRDDIERGLLASSRVAWCFGACTVLSSILVLLIERPRLDWHFIRIIFEIGLCALGLCMHWVWIQRRRTRDAADPRIPYEEEPPSP